MIKITTTYQIVSPESSEIGEYEEQGWHDEEGETFDSPSEAVEFLTDNYVTHPSEYPSEASKSWSTSDYSIEYETGNKTSYTFHIDTDIDTLKKINALIVDSIFEP